VKNADTESVDADLDDTQNNYVTGQRGTTDDAEMLADSTCQRDMYKTYQEEDEDKAYPEKAAMPRTITNVDPQNNSVLSQTGIEDVARRPMPPQRRGSTMYRRSCAKKTCRTGPTRTALTCPEPSPTIISTPTVPKTDRPTAWQTRRRPRRSP
jgi:hypothetical protein